MRNLLLSILTIFIFVACGSNNNVVISKPVNQSIQKNDTKLEAPTITYEYIEQSGNNTISEEKSFVPHNSGDEFKIAVIYPSKIVGKYGNSAVNTILGYLFYKNSRFDVETFDSLDESVENIYSTVNSLIDGGYTKVIALYTPSGYETLKNISSLTEVELFFPLIEKNEDVYVPSNFIFGSISYKEQMKKLLEYSDGNDSQFYEESSIGYRLKSIYESLVYNVNVNQNIQLTNNRFKEIVTNERLKESSIMLNTPVVKSSIILSQLYAYETGNGPVLSTQLNFNPLLISLTQYEDRLNLLLANSIEETDDKLTEIMTLMESDVQYNWVNYSTLVGVNYLFSRNSDNLIKNEVLNSKVIYNTNVYYSDEQSFKQLPKDIIQENIIEKLEEPKPTTNSYIL